MHDIHVLRSPLLIDDKGNQYASRNVLASSFI